MKEGGGGATFGDANQTELGCRNGLKKEERVETGKKDAALLWKVSHSLNVCFMVTDFRQTKKGLRLGMITPNLGLFPACL